MIQEVKVSGLDLARIAVVLAALLLPAGTVAQGQDPEQEVALEEMTPPEWWQRPPHTITLDNGLEVAILAREDHPLVQVDVYYPIGPFLEPEGQDGISHVLEHLMFTSTAANPDGGLRAALDLYACSWNGYTLGSYTRYTSSCVPALLPDLLRIEADRMSGLSPDPSEFEREKNVVLEEVAMRSFYDARRDLDLAVHRALFPEHPFGRAIGGTQATVGSLTEEDLREFARRFHGPRGAVLVIIGDVSVGGVERLVSDLFGPLEPNAEPAPRVPPLPDPPEGDVVRLDRHDLQRMRTALVYRLPRETEEDHLLAFFARELFDDDDVARAALTTQYRDAYVLRISNGWRYRTRDWSGTDVEIDPLRDEQEVLVAIRRKLGEQIDETLTKDGYEDFRERSLRGIRRGFESPSVLSRWIGEALLVGEIPEWITRIDEIAEPITRERFRDYLSEHLVGERSVYGVAHGLESGRMTELPSPRTIAGTSSETATSDPDRAIDPAEVERVLETYRAAAPERVRGLELSSGLPVYVLSLKGTQSSHVRVSREFPALSDERRGKRRGLTSLYNWLLQDFYPPEYDGGKPAPGLSVHATPFSYSVSASAEPERLEDVARVVGATLRSEELPASDWNGIHRSIDSHYGTQQRRGAQRAARWRWETLLSEEDPTLGRLSPLPEEAKKIKFTDAKKAHGKLTELAGASLFVVTSPQHAECEDLVEGVFGSLESKDGKPGELPTCDLEGVTGHIVPEFRQQDLDLVLEFPPVVRGDGPAAWARARLAETVAEDRLKFRLREKEGLVYFLHVELVSVPAGVVPRISTACRPDDGPRTFAVLREEMARLREGVAEAELSQARLAELRDRARWPDSSSRATSALADLARYGPVPEDPHGVLMEIGAEDVTVAIREWMSPDRFVYSIVGPLFEEDITRFE